MGQSSVVPARQSVALTAIRYPPSMVASRKPPTSRKPAASRTAKRPSSRPKRETIDELMERILAEPLGTPLDITKKQAYEILRRLAGTRNDLPPGQQIIDEFYGLNPDGSIKRGRPKKR